MFSVKTLLLCVGETATRHSSWVLRQLRTVLSEAQRAPAHLRRTGHPGVSRPETGFSWAEGKVGVSTGPLLHYRACHLEQLLRWSFGQGQPVERIAPAGWKGEVFLGMG